MSHQHPHSVLLESAVETREPSASVRESNTRESVTDPCELSIATNGNLQELAPEVHEFFTSRTQNLPVSTSEIIKSAWFREKKEKT